MKRALLLIFSCTMLASCHKKSCWSCDINSAGVKFTETLCDKSKKEIIDLQAKPQETKNQAGEVIYSTSYTNCVQQ